MPASIEAEKSILGAILLDNQAFYKTLEVLDPDEFYRPAHARIFKAMKELADQTLKADDFYLDSHRRLFSRIMDLMETGRPVDIITLTEELSKKKEVESVGGVAYISSLTDGLPRRPSIAQYVRIVRDKALLRSLIHACSGAMARAAEQADPAEEIIDAAESAIFQISENRIGQGFLGIPEIVKQSFGSVDEI
jgi:replicative DNA helicase